jgi:hypothetical protein
LRDWALQRGSAGILLNLDAFLDLSRSTRPRAAAPNTGDYLALKRESRIYRAATFEVASQLPYAPPTTGAKIRPN